MLICLPLNLSLLLHIFLMPVKCCSGLSYGTDDHSLRDAFTNYGQVIEGTIPFALFVALFFLLHLSLLYFLLTIYASICPARVIMDRESGRSRGFGFVTYTSSEEASAAITAMDGKVSSYLGWLLSSAFWLAL